MSRHVCPVAHCIVQVSDRFLMCGDHWAMVPRGLQRNVYAAYRGGEGVGTIELAHAQAAAIEAVDARLGYTGAPS